MAQFTRFPKTALCFIAPQIVVTLVFFIWPAFGALFESFFFSDVFATQHHYAGLNNFIDLFVGGDYLAAVCITLVLAVSITLLSMVLGLTLAMLVNGQRRGQHVYKVFLLWPYAIAPAVAAILWRFLCHPTLGWLTALFKWFGVDFNYLIHPSQAILVVILAASWQQLSYNFLFFYAALKMIPSSFIEAAILDGASSWQRFWHILFPLLSPTTFFLLIMNVLFSFYDTFGIIHVMTNGGPGHSTTTLVYKVYKDGFIGMDVGSSAAQSVVLIFVVVVLTLLQFKFLEKKVYYT